MDGNSGELTTLAC